MNRRRPFRLLNVFAPTPLGGNPLAVFEDGRGLDDATMQALALQFNLSETTFVLPSVRATARVRIFTPTFEMPFAGHPTLGTAHVVRDLVRRGALAPAPGEEATVTLEMIAGVIPVCANGDRWALVANAPRCRAPDASRELLAAMLGLSPGDLAGAPLWIDTGSEQLVIPMASADAVHRAAPNAELMNRHGHNGTRAMAYVWSPTAGDGLLARFFFPKHGAIVEDPGTGSACANLGGWWLATGQPLPMHREIRQGEMVGKPCRLFLAVDSTRVIRVGGDVIEIGRGEIEFPGD